jgi:hypothetical protein
MLCNLPDLNAAIDWLRRENQLTGDGPACFEYIHYRGAGIYRPFVSCDWFIARRDGYALLVAPWLVDEIKQLATKEV